MQCCLKIWLKWGTLVDSTVILEQPGMQLKWFLTLAANWVLEQPLSQPELTSTQAGGSIEHTDVWGCTYRHMLAQCRSIGPVCWALPHTWWHWHHEECNLGYTRKAPPYPFQSHSQCASRSEARARSCTGKHWSSEQLQKCKKKKTNINCHFKVWSL